jgi:hypothetical protein
MRGTFQNSVRLQSYIVDSKVRIKIMYAKTQLLIILKLYYALFRRKERIFVSVTNSARDA